MSIPPLVCTTPPPPDQCEDDKDPEDFDVRYNLSQEDYDENNDFGFENFSSYSHFQFHTSTKQIEGTAKVIGNEENKNDAVCDSNMETKNGCDQDEVLETTREIKLKSEEDTNIEDLNLNIDDDSIDLYVKENNEINEIEVSPVKEDSINIPDISSDIRQENENIHLSPNSPCKDNTPEATPDSVIESELFVDGINEDQPQNIEVNICETGTVSNNSITDHDKFTEICYEVPKELNSTDDDFDDFQFISADNKPATVIENCDNPWSNKQIDDSDFGNFTADFGDTESKPEKPCSLKIEHTSETNQFQNKVQQNSPEDDDFGDFDDFKSSEVESEPQLFQQVPVLNLQSSENELQIVESINKVLYSIFEQEITQPDTEFEMKLESILSETWGHLMETDVRQPYIVNWNNSFGQKTLLKALCIDSRNILFGPKWSHNMPKYAANLSIAPLQPQKQQAPLNASQPEFINSDKPTNRTDTWADPFTADGQKFTYAEALLLDLEHLMATLDQMAHNHSTLKISELLSHACNTGSESAIVATDLDLLEAAMSTKTEKIYSNTISVQPLRQINLPDTHIFTPTDSETPRSKTIHYDSGPTVLLPQPVTENNSNQAENVPTQSTSEVNKVEDDEYWEYQDFKSTSSGNNMPNIANQPVQSIDKVEVTATSSNALTKPNVVYQTQILQPIKMEPIMPTLNWPDPGEVKLVYDDFSDFVSDSSWANDKQVPTSRDESIEASTGHDKPTDHINENEIPQEKEVTKESIGNGFDDDEFDTFQSALPTKNPGVDVNPNGLSNDTNTMFSQNSTAQASSNQMPNFDYAFPKISNVKAGTISFTNARPTEALTQNVGFISNTTELHNKNSLSTGTNLQTNLLQPIPASSTVSLTQNQQKSGQILQPLTLESYSHINWPSPGIDLQDLSRFNPVETLQSLKSDLSVSGHNKNSPIHNQKSVNNNQVPDEDVWGEFVSIKPKPQQPLTKKQSTFGDEDEWTDFVSSPSVKPQNGLNTISLNVHTNLNMQKTANQGKLTVKNNQTPLDIPTLNYITPKANNKTYNDRHFQNL